MASAAVSFHRTWRIGRPVQEVSAPRLKGVIKAVHGTGNNAQIVVTIPGRPPVTLHPSQLTPL